MSIIAKRIIVVAHSSESACRAEFDGDGKYARGDKDGVCALLRSGADFIVKVRGTKGENDSAGADHPVAKKVLEQLKKKSTAATPMPPVDGDSSDKNSVPDDDSDVTKTQPIKNPAKKKPKSKK